MAFTLNEISLILVALLIGLVIGLMLSGRGKYKRLWRAEQQAHRQTIKERAVPAVDPDRVREADVADRHVSADGRNDLTRIRGISAQDATALNEAGYHRYSQIGALNDEQQAILEGRLGRAPGTIAREEWGTQARLLETGKVREHERRYIEN